MEYNLRKFKRKRGDIMDYNALAEMMANSFWSAVKPTFLAVLPYLALGTLVIIVRYAAAKVRDFFTGKLR